MSKNKNNKSIEINKPVDMLASNVKITYSDAKDVDIDKIEDVKEDPTAVEVDVNDILILLVEQLTAIKSYMKSQDETLAAIMERLKKPSIF
jgi:hypothetical protein